ncbi:hypothetical protein O181_005366 [Austropuccinia psidii MF-1]|uniref:Uncharacterized protein n=1 Tax=Austropuccinia psidii MF-1 TaxID=1389203 RepID=A0A9Q3BIQ3_9BASI|nr:hypothetical protein [Austropuccinia psidii MF-1]
MVAIIRPFKDTNQLVLQVLVISYPPVFPQGNTGPGFFKGNTGPAFFKGKFQEVVNHKISFKGTKHSSTPWTTQLIHTGSIQEACVEVDHLGQFIFHCGNSRHTVHFSRWPDFY